MKPYCVYFAAVNLHLSRVELGRMTPGLFFDMVQLWKKANIPPKQDEY